MVKKIIAKGQQKDFQFDCEVCLVTYISNEYNVITIPGNRNFPAEVRYHDKCPNCKNKVIAIPKKE